MDNQESREDDVRNGIELDGDSLYQVEIDVEVGDRVTAIYCDDNQQQKSWFVGQVKDIDESDDDSIHFVHVAVYFTELKKKLLNDFIVDNEIPTLPLNAI